MASFVVWQMNAMLMRQTLAWVSLLVLVMLEAGCHKSSRMSRSASRTSDDYSEADWTTKRRRGIDFTAFGSEPSWTLDMDFSEDLRLKQPDGSVLVAPVPRPERSGRGSGVMFITQAKTRPVRVTIDPVIGRDKITGKEYAYSVRIEAGDKRYTGYGTFLRGITRLEDTWVLETFRGQRIRAEQFTRNQLPYISIDLKDNRISGFSGCNELRGKVKAENDELQIEAAPATRRACSGSFEANFLKALRSATLYRIGKNRLTLYANGQYVMSLRKAENTASAAR